MGQKEKSGCSRLIGFIWSEILKNVLMWVLGVIVTSLFTACTWIFGLQSGFCIWNCYQNQPAIVEAAPQVQQPRHDSISVPTFGESVSESNLQGCPYFNDMGQLRVFNRYYVNAYYEWQIGSYDTLVLEVADYYGNPLNYYPNVQGYPNEWHYLEGSPFSACINIYGEVFVRYTW